MKTKKKKTTFADVMLDVARMAKLNRVVITTATQQKNVGLTVNAEQTQVFKPNVLVMDMLPMMTMKGGGDEKN